MSTECQTLATGPWQSCLTMILQLMMMDTCSLGTLPSHASSPKIALIRLIQQGGHIWDQVYDYYWLTRPAIPVPRQQRTNSSLVAAVTRMTHSGQAYCGAFTTGNAIILDTYTSKSKKRRDWDANKKKSNGSKWMRLAGRCLLHA
jgi:hypothetical protein